MVEFGNYNFSFDKDESYAILKNIFYQANKSFIKKDISLIKDDVAERTLCGALTSHLEHELKSMHISGYYVDVEYNRNNGQIKTIFDDDWSVVKVQCDLIIHSRGEIVAQDNLIAIEMKKDYRDEEDCETDRKRLRALTKSTYNNDIWSFDGETFPEHVCRYILGIFYFIDERKHLIKLEYYRNGKIESKKVIRLLKQ